MLGFLPLLCSFADVSHILSFLIMLMVVSLGMLNVCAENLKQQERNEEILIVVIVVVHASYFCFAFSSVQLTMFSMMLAQPAFWTF